MKDQGLKFTGRMFLVLLTGFLLMGLLGCGESGSQEGDPASITLSAGQEELLADNTSSTSITADVIDSSGSAVGKHSEVTFETTLGSFRNDKQKYVARTEDDSGSVTVSFKAGATQGTAEITASANGVKQKIEIELVESLSPENIELSLTPASIRPGTDAAVSAKVESRSGTPVPDVTVRFDVQSNASGGEFETGSETTDENGNAEVFYTAGSQEGTDELSATIDGTEQSDSIELNVDPSAAMVGSVELVSNEQTVNGDANSQLPIEARVFDTEGNPISDLMVNFQTSTGVFKRTFNSAADGWTNESGIAEAVFRPADSQDGTAQIRASVAGISDEIELFIVPDSVVVGSVSLTSGAEQLSVGGNPAAIRATVQDDEGEPIPGIKVDFTTTNGALTDDGAAAEDLTAFTGKKGIAEVTLESGNSPGNASVTATARGVSQSVEVPFVAGAPANVNVESAPDTLNPGDTAELTATVEDDYGNAVENEAVKFKITDNQSGASLENTTAETNVNGDATVTYTAGSEEGSDQITAVAQSNSTTGTVTVVVDPAAVVVDSVAVSSGAESLTANGESKSTIRATVTDKEGNPAPGIKVKFDTTLGTLPAGKTGTQTTDENGVAERVLTSGTKIGTARVTAEAAGFAESVDVPFVAGAPSKLTLTALPLIVNPEETSRLTATLTDKHCNPAADETIVFRLAQNNSGAMLSSKKETTDDSGQVTIDYTAGANNGDDVITAHSTTNSSIKRREEIVVGGQVSLKADPDHIEANGTDTSTFTATVLNNAGDPMKDVPVVFKNISDIVLSDEQPEDSSETFEGTGRNDTPVFLHDGGEITFTMSHAGTGLFSVDLYDSNGNWVDLIKSTSGSISGQVSKIRQPAGEYYLNVWADGDWTIEVESAGQAISPVGNPNEPDAFDSLPALSLQKTDAGGKAVYTYTGSTVAEAVTYGVQAGNVRAEDTLEQVAGKPANIEVYAAPNTVTPHSRAGITARVTDENGNAVKGETVDFEIKDDNSNASLGSNTATTDLSGEAVISYTAGDTDQVTDTLKATVKTLSDTANVDVDSSAVMVGSITIESVGDDSLPADGVSDVTIRAKVEDMDGEPISDLAVAFTASAGTINSSVVTNDDGIAQTTLISSENAGIAKITAIASGFRATRDIEFTAGTSDSLDLNVAPGTINPGGESTVTATLKDAKGNPVEGESIAFDLVTNKTGASLSDLSAETNINGHASITYTAGTASELSTDRIRASSLTDSSIDDFSNIDVDPSATVVGGVEASAGSSELEADGESQATIRATVTDTEGNPAAGKTVTFTTAAGTLTEGDISPNQATTDDNGIAEITLTSTTKTGTVTVRAESDGFIGSTDIGFVGGPVSNIILRAIPDTVQPDGGFTIFADVMDGNNNQLAGQTVTFVVYEAGDTTTPLDTLQRITDEDGFASADFSAVYGKNELDIWAETANGTTEKVKVSVDADAVVVDNVEVISGSDALTADDNDETMIRATVTDLEGNAASDKEVVFETTLGSLSDLSVTTDANGIAETTLESGTDTGTATVTADASGIKAAVDVGFVAAAPATIELAAAPETVNPEGPSTLTATVTDSNDNLVVGETVNFNFGTNATNASLSSPSAVTDVNGEATVTYTAGSAEGTDTVLARSASNATVSGDADITVDADAVVVDNVEVISGSDALTADDNDETMIRAT
ncbi:MAG: Ig-like domain-containing protein, partial [Thermodesulfobacteriota bacterium]